MSTESQNLLASFDALPIADQQAVAAEIARRVAEKSAATDEIVSEETSTADEMNAEEWIKKFHAWTDSQPAIRNPNLDDSRESIYEGCGE